MFEKFSNQDVDAGGSGGEYTVQAGFGWTNGVALWVASQFGDVLVAPQCPNPLIEAAVIGGSGTQKSGVPSLNGGRMGTLSAALGTVAGYLLL
ncbi:hypothetical protein EWM64_g8759 [Hericium alpestre]|uniref:alpha,alpha-trehalase n=1 Tax=Hericium alpestre TaxID=135208 RepID=A0A4Y9ZLU7_9AGAM|nr:hypothetical protein EWM64_g8759 [Hericium alpestre]